MTNHTSEKKGISVIMPTYNQGSFILCAIQSFMCQSFKESELIIINDGCTDNTHELLLEILNDSRIKYFKNHENKGLGACLNLGIAKAQYNYIAYLPSDDVYYKDHLQTLYDTLISNADAVLAYSGLRYLYTYNTTSNKSTSSKGQVTDYFLQLVQVLHKKTGHTWMERDEKVTDDLSKMFWHKIIGKGIFVPTNNISCEWSNHVKQRHKIISKNHGGGISAYREYYKVNVPIKFESTAGDLFDEKEYYSILHKKPMPDKKGLKILLVGELSYNPERICAFEELGHTLYGLWIQNSSIFFSVGPLPFGNVVDIQYNDWVQQVKAIQPDIIYAQQSAPSVKLAFEVMRKMPNVPFVWHYKEGPFMSRDRGEWNELIELYSHADGQVFIHQLAKDWYGQFLPPAQKPSIIIDGDLPKNIWFNNNKSPLLSETDGELHTLYIGRPVGINPEDIEILAKQKIHLHFYGTYQVSWKDWVVKAKKHAPEYFHLHPNCYPNNWVKEFSKYDAAWLHYFKSENDGDLLKVSWHDMNYPARLSSFAAAGLPLIQYNNSGHLVACQQLAQDLDIGIFISNFEELGAHLTNKKRMEQLRENIWKNRLKFSFDYYVPELIVFFESLIELKKKSQNKVSIVHDCQVLS